MLKILLIVFAAAVVLYALVTFIDKRVSRRRQVSKPLAPDDDLDFLRNLEWEQRKERKRRKDDGSPDVDPEDDSGAGNLPDSPA